MFDNTEDAETTLFKSPAQFSMHIEKMAFELKISHMDAVLKYCEDTFVEPDDIKHLINKTLRDKIEVDLIESNMLPKRATLEVE